MAADNLTQGKAERPLERSALVPRVAWIRCSGCGASFGSREGLRSHRRFARCPVIRDVLDDPSLKGTELAQEVRRRLRDLAGKGEE